MNYAIQRLLSVLVSILAVLGLVKPVPDNVMSYTAEELALQDGYLRFSQGAEVTVYETKNAAEPLYTGTVRELCELPEATLPDGAYVRYSAYLAFGTTGNQHLRVTGAKNTEISVSFNEVNTKTYTPFTVFKKDVFYKINIGFTLPGGSTPAFHADGEYRISVHYPSFGGEPTEEILPMADIHLRDPYIMTGADGRYYMTGTYDPVDWSNTREIHIYRSDDLRAWEDLGAVWNYERDADWQKKLITDGSSPIWAPELHYIRGNYYLCYSLGWGAMAGSVLRSKTGLPEGPYEDICGKAVFDSIDSTFFTDDDGTVYAVWADGRYAVMSRDMKRLTTVKRSLLSESGQPAGFEGCCVIKINGLYYLCSAAYTTHYRPDGSSYLSYDSYYAVSSRFAGPYSERRLLLINGGHGNLFFAKDGTLYTTLFSGALQEKPAIAEIEVTSDGLLKVK